MKSRKLIKVVHLQIFSENTGRAALRLHQALLKNGINSGMITLRASVNDDNKTRKWLWDCAKQSVLLKGEKIFIFLTFLKIPSF